MPLLTNKRYPYGCVNRSWCRYCFFCCVVRSITLHSFWMGR